MTQAPSAAAPVPPASSRPPARWWRSSAGFVSIGAAVVLAVVAFAALFGVGHSDSAVRFFKGDAWLPSDDSGSVVRVNGATGKPDFEMRFHGANGADLQVIQGPDGVFVLNRDTGEVTKLDDAQLQLGGSIKADPADKPAFLIGGGKAFLVSQRTGRVQQVDPTSAALDPVGPVIELHHPVTNAVVDPRGHLVAAIGETGELAFVADGKADAPVRVADAGDELRVSLVDDQLFAIDHTKATVAPVDPTTGVQTVYTIDVARDGTLAVTEKMSGPRLWMAHVQQARLIGIDATTGRQTKLDLAEVQGHELGAPLPNGAFVYVPDYQLGALLKVDPETGKIVDRARVVDTNDPALGESNGRPFTAFVKDDRVWGNDPRGQVAVVIDRQGNAQQIEKYREGLPNNDDLAPLPDALPATTLPAIPRTPPTTTPRPDPGGGPTTTQPAADPRENGDPGRADPKGAGPVEKAPAGPVLPDPAGANQRTNGGGAPTTTTSTTAPPPSANTPGAPSGVLAVAGDASATVTWKAAADNGSPITKYVITDTARSVTKEVPGTTLTADVTGLTNGTAYTFSVHAANAVGDGPDATAAPVTPLAALPGAPATLTATYAYATGTTEQWFPRVQWAPPTVHPELVSHYEANCVPASGTVTPQLPAVVGPTVLTADFPDMALGVAVTCWVQAVDAGGHAGPRATLPTGTTLVPWGTPDKATNISAHITVNDCQLTWTTGFDGGRPISGYEVVVDHYDLSLGWQLYTDDKLQPSATPSINFANMPGGDYRAQIYITNRDPATGNTTSSVYSYYTWTMGF